MNKRVKVIIMLIIVLLISGLCFPIISEAQRFFRIRIMIIMRPCISYSGKRMLFLY